MCHVLTYDIVHTVVEKVGKLAAVWKMPLFSMSAMRSDLRDPANYGTLVRLSTPADRLATALLTFCHYNDVCTSFTSIFLNAKDLPRGTVTIKLGHWFGVFWGHLKMQDEKMTDQIAGAGWKMTDLENDGSASRRGGGENAETEK